MGERTGFILPHSNESARFGFIRQDCGEEDMFVLPLACPTFGGILPPSGTRVVYSVEHDPKNAKWRATDVRPESGLVGNQAFGQVVERMAGELAGIMLTRRQDTFGFIKQDNGGEDMFVLPGACVAFGGWLPPAGTRVLFVPEPDPQNGRMRASQVRPESGELPPGMPPPFDPHATAQAAAAGPGSVANLGGLGASAAPQTQPHQFPCQKAELLPGERTGTILARNGEGAKFGFIKQDTGDEDMFVLPLACSSFGGILPPVGTRVIYSLELDPKSQRMRALNVRPESGHVSGGAPAAVVMNPGERSGIMLARRQESFGFIKQDNGEEDMFVLPGACVAFGGALPAAGTRVLYVAEPELQTGKVRANHVRPEVSGSALDDSSVELPGLGEESGMVLSHSGKFAFIKRDNGLPDMYLLPSACQAFGGILPAVGTRVIFSAEHDDLNMRERAAGVRPERGLSGFQNTGIPTPGVPQPDERAGIMLSGNGKFGFIKQDNGEDDMFVLPLACATFGGVLPPVGTRLRFTVEMDKHGKLRAQNVRAENIDTFTACVYGSAKSSQRSASSSHPYAPGQGASSTPIQLPHLEGVQGSGKSQVNLGLVLKAVQTLTDLEKAFGPGTAQALVSGLQGQKRMT